jgi:hypothetical protein
MPNISYFDNLVCEFGTVAVLSYFKINDVKFVNLNVGSIVSSDCVTMLIFFGAIKIEICQEPI